ncbi:MAG TPA: PepSY domain-containing protein [Verrucomicrobiae bacterium]|nr:PepSY domain-containing protein [Verrucomicrobiae bacterium]
MRIAAIAVALVIASTPSLAQDRTPAVNTPNTTNPAAPVEGANSFTEGQAKSRIESNGFTSVSGLSKDDKGIWRGKANKDGKQVDVTLDFQGNVVSK